MSQEMCSVKLSEIVAVHMYHVSSSDVLSLVITQGKLKFARLLSNQHFGGVLFISA
jgi:hypothetical protein